MFAQLINRINRTATDETPSDGLSTANDPFELEPPAVTAEQRDLIHLALDWVDAPLVFFDHRLVVQFANAAYCTFVGRARSELVGGSIDDALAGRAGGGEGYARRALAGESVDVDIAHRHDGVLDGVSRVQYRPQRDADGVVVGALCMLHRLGRRQADQAAAANEAAERSDAGDGMLDGAFDRTFDATLLPLGGATVNAPLRAALRLAQDDVVERERKQRELIESLPLPLVFIGNDGRCKWANAAFGATFDVADDDIAGVAASDLAGLPEATMREGLGTANTGRAHSVEAELSLGSGTSRWYRIDFLPGFDRDDVQNGVYVLLSDVTESRLALTRLRDAEARTAEDERAVRERDERIRFLTDNLPAHIVYLDVDMRVQYGNSRFLADHRMTRLDEAIGKSPEELIDPGAAAQVRTMAAAALRGERVAYEWPMTPDPADERWVSVSISGDFDEAGAPRGVYIIAYDISDSKRSESDRLRQQQLIEAFIENFPQPLAYLDPHGVHLHTNRAYEEFIERSKADIAGRSGVAVFGREIAVDFDPPFQQALAGRRAHGEHSVSLSGGPRRFVSSDWLPDVGEAGAVRGVYLVVQDVNEARLARLAYEESLREMQRAMDSVALPISFVDRDERLRFVNRATTTWHGRSAEELIGMRLADLMSDDDYRFAKPYVDAALSGESVQYEREMRYHDGARRWVLIRYVPTRDEQRVVTGFYTTATDIQARKKHEIALQQANGLLTAHFENTPLASFTLDESRRITRWSSQAETLFGWQRDEAIERSFDELALVDPDFAPDFLPHDEDPDTTFGNTRLHVVETRRRDGTTVTCEWHIAALRNATGRIASTLVLVQDVSQRVEAERRLTEIAHRDTLTRLLNRNALEPTLRAYIERARQSGTGVAVMFLDLDHFKNINDTLGHRVGDLMLIEVAAILRHSVRAEDQVARIGGDEFMVVIEHKSPKSIAHETAQRILAALSTPIRVDNQRLSVTSSIGIAICPDHGRAPEALIRSADLAMYRAKENGKNRFEFFSALLAQRSERRAAVKGALKLAMQKEALRLYFQPRVRIADGRIVGAEALLRWTDPRLGVVSPKEFIVIAEESGLIHELGLYVFRKACRQLRDWQDRGIVLGMLSVNFSAHQLLVATFVDEVADVIEETGVDPRFIEVEITETSMLFDLGVTKNVIADLKQRGMRIAIDDFGTGFSSLSHLQQLDVDTLKIDQSFIRDMLHDAGDAAITTSVISLAKGLGLSTTAEGVEQERQLEVLRTAGCDYYQGFLFSPAIVVEDIEELLVAQDLSTTG